MGNRDWALAGTLSLFLFAVYLATFAGVLRSIDELGLFALTENLVQSGGLATPLVRFARVHNGVGAFEPGYSILATPLYWLARRWPGISNMHAVMLMNPALTALTGGALYALGRRLRYTPASSACLALAFGLATMAWPYTKSLLREPLVALLWTLAFIGLAEHFERPGWRPAAFSIAPAVMSLLVKVTSVALLPVILGMMAWAFYRRRGLPSVRALSLSSLGVVALAALATLILSQRGYSVTELSARLVSDVFSRSGLTPWYGLLASPGKSVFVYSPVLLLGVFGWPRFHRRHGWMAASVLLASVSTLVLLRAHGSWWGGLTWGPRFLVPLLPIALLPALELLPGRPWAWAIAAVSAGFQALVASSAWPVAYRVLLSKYTYPDLEAGLDWSRWSETPAFQLIQSWGRPSLDLIWLHPGLAGEMKLDWALGLTLAVVVGVSGACVVFAFVGRWHPMSVIAGAAAVMLGAVVLLQRGYADLPDFPGLSGEEARNMAEAISSDPSRSKEVVYVSPDFGTYFWLGLMKGPASTTWVSPAETDGFELVMLDERSAPFTVVVDRPHIASIYPGDNLVSWLNAHSYRFGSGWQGGIEIIRYATPPEPMAPDPAFVEWPNGIALTGIGFPPSVRLGEVLPVDVHLKCLADGCRTREALFVHLLGEDGSVISGQDGPPQYGNLASSGWHAGDAVLDRRGIWIPHAATPGTYALIVGFSSAGAYLPAALETGEVVDYAELGSIAVGSVR